ncbi:hypothetical protein Aph01nite_15680 [Acrocarpospora phusangensis]|uniref:DNA primase n=1 Tax=Acrocarpospora phusangensis TaxID=1070424 RepID=A0A919Q7A0_9ACTN|nr:hypothetical protein [Acrocarpospora phusangensis]GIH23258.1 hypothetical protein Aph01nite_15680 [Acrocarpospora phusangensis]
MTSRVKVALAVAVGYYLGRNHKLKTAVSLAMAGAAGQLRAHKGKLLEQGLKVLDSPELNELTGRLRHDLREAGRTAAVAATSKQINALSDKIHSRAEMLRHPEEQLKAAAAKGTETAETVTKAAGGTAKQAAETVTEQAGGPARTVTKVVGGRREKGDGRKAPEEEAESKTREDAGTGDRRTESELRVSG